MYRRHASGSAATFDMHSDLDEPEEHHRLQPLYDLKVRLIMPLVFSVMILFFILYYLRLAKRYDLLRVEILDLLRVIAELQSRCSVQEFAEDSQ